MNLTCYALAATLLLAPLTAKAKDPAVLFANGLLYNEETNTSGVMVGLWAIQNLTDVWVTVRISADTRTIVLPKKVACSIIRDGEVIQDYATHAITDGQGIKLYFPHIEKDEKIRFGVAFENRHYFAERVSIVLESAQGKDSNEWSFRSTDKPGLQPLRMVMEDAYTCTLL